MVQHSMMNKYIIGQTRARCGMGDCLHSL